MNLLGYICWLLAKCIHSMSMFKQENKCWRITFLQEIVIYHLLSLMSFKTCMHFSSWTWKILWSMSKLLHTEKGHLGLLISIVVKKHHGSSPKVLKDSLFTEKKIGFVADLRSHLLLHRGLYSSMPHEDTVLSLTSVMSSASWFFMLHYSAKIEYL